MIFNLIKEIKAKSQISEDFILLLYLLNAGIVMNFHKFIVSHIFISLLFIVISIVTLINLKYYRLLFINFFVATILLTTSFPRIGNHSTFLMLSILATLVLFARKIIFNKGISKELLTYIFRCFLVIVYFYAGFHKLNTSFFNPCVSCVNELNEINISNFTFSEYKISENISIFIQYATIFLEMVLPFGLLFYKTRKATCLLFLCFHFYLIFAGFAHFASVALFLIIGGIMLYRNQSIDYNSIRIYIIFLVFSVLSRLVFYKYGIQENKIVFYQGIIFSIGWVYFVFHYFYKLKPIPTIFYKKHIPILSAMFLILSFWTLKTYIGLGNQGNLTMFSNLATDSKNHNHLLLDVNKLRLFEYENDCIQFIEFVNPDNKNDDFSGYLLPMVEFQYYIKHWENKHKKPISCTLKYKNKIYTIDDLSKSQFNQGKWWYKYLSFRRIQANEPNECRW